MAQTNLKALIEKLNPVTRKALESAAGLSLSQTHYEVDAEHFLVRLLESENTDVHRIFRYFEIDPDRVITDLGRAMASFKTGNSRTPALSPRIPAMVREGWLLASVEFCASSVRSGHILLGLLDHTETARMVIESAPDLRNISVETLKAHFFDLTRDSEEAKQAGPAQAAPGKSGAGQAAGKPAGERALDQFTINLTERAQNGEIDPVLGRDDEIRQMIDILIRRRQNNPILTGEAGVGKTAVVEGFALRIAEGDVPEPLKNIALHVLDLGLLQAGAGIKGEFENRLKSVIDEVKASPVPIILFIDEAHTLIGAGGAQGAGDAANLLKPALARGELRTIAATTWSEYKKYFEKDAALARRFQVVKIDEPDEPRAMVMMRAIAPFLEQHHQVVITDDAILDAVRLSHRYISGRQLPDKAVSVLDTACARVAIGLQASPPAMEAAVRDLGQIEREMKRLKRESLTGRDHGERMSALEGRDQEVRERLEALEKRLKAEMGVARELMELRQAIFASGEEGEEASPDLPGQQEKYRELEAKLAEIQGDDPLLSIAVDGNTVSEVVSAWTGIPTGRMLTDEIESVLALKDNLQKRIIGQNHALASIAQVVQTTHAGIEDPSKPTGVFMMVGPSGVGKTETALALSELLYGGEQNLITINMSEYQEAHTVSGLKGSPPGYVGFGEGGVLTEAVRRRPYSVVLLDEVEKAHPDVMELFYQVFDKGMLEDSEGVPVDFRNTVLLLTSNVASEIILETGAHPRRRPDAETLSEWIRPELLRHFRPALLGRLVVVPYFPLDADTIQEIVGLQMRKIQDRFREHHRLPLTYSPELAVEIAVRCTQADTGARNVDNILTHHLLPELSAEMLRRMAQGRDCSAVHVDMDGAGDFVYRFDEPEAGVSSVSEREAMPRHGTPTEAAPETDAARSRRLHRRKASETEDTAMPAEPSARPFGPGTPFPPPVVHKESAVEMGQIPPGSPKAPVPPEAAMTGPNGGRSGSTAPSHWETTGKEAPSLAEQGKEADGGKPSAEDAPSDEAVMNPASAPQNGLPAFLADRRRKASEPSSPDRFRPSWVEETDDSEFEAALPRFFIEGPQTEAADTNKEAKNPRRKPRKGWLRRWFGR